MAKVPDRHCQQIIKLFIWIFNLFWLMNFCWLNFCKLMELTILSRAKLSDPWLLCVHHFKFSHHNSIDKIYFGFQYLQLSPIFGQQISPSFRVSFHSFRIKLLNDICYCLIFLNFSLTTEHSHVTLLYFSFDFQIFFHLIFCRLLPFYKIYHKLNFITNMIFLNIIELRVLIL